MASEKQDSPRDAAVGTVMLTVSVIDCRDQLCPKPIIMIKRALAEAAPDQILEMIVNDHGSKENVLKYCWNHGQEITKSHEDGKDFHIFVRKSPEKKVDAPVPVMGPCGARWD
jgi:TusA-related sulfurtransferase